MTFIYRLLTVCLCMLYLWNVYPTKLQFSRELSPKMQYFVQTSPVLLTSAGFIRIQRNVADIT